MKVLDLDFVPLDDVPLRDILGAVGVYVLWSPTVRDVPTYLGEGVLLERLSKHVDWLRRGVTDVRRAERTARLRAGRYYVFVDNTDQGETVPPANFSEDTADVRVVITVE